MIDLLKKERPLFVSTVFEKLGLFKTNGTSLSDNFIECFHQILNGVQTEFLSRKSEQLQEFFKSQIRFLENSYQMSFIRSEDPDNSVSIHIHHIHMAYLSPPKDAMNTGKATLNC